MQGLLTLLVIIPDRSTTIKSLLYFLCDKLVKHRHLPWLTRIAPIWHVLWMWWQWMGRGGKHVQCLQVQWQEGPLWCVSLQAPSSASTTGLWQKLHWLPVRQRIIFKMATVTFKARNLSQPAYLHDLLQEFQPTRTLCSSTLHSSSSTSNICVHLSLFSCFLRCCTYRLEPTD